MTQEYIYIKELPKEHPIRNTPLIQINAFYLVKDGVAWREVFPAFGIANKTFNELSEVWTRHDNWRTNSGFAHQLDEEYREKRMNVIGSNGNCGLHYE